MDWHIHIGDLTQYEGDGLVVNLFEGVKEPGGATGAVDRALGGLITSLIQAGEIRGKLNEVTLVHTAGRLPVPRVAVVGLGKREEFTADKVRQVTASAMKALRKAGAQKVGTILHGAGVGQIHPEQAAQAVVEGAELGLYQFRAYKTEPAEWPGIKAITILERDPAKEEALRSGIRQGRILAQATCLARDWVNMPANDLTPAALAEKAREVAEQNGLEWEILEQEDLERLGMNLLLGVAAGSAQPPRFIVLHYRPPEAQGPPLGLVGKAITFDTGGISLKSAERMEEMKGDMAGGAAVIAAMQAIAQLEPNIQVTALVPATENTPGGRAQKPGDIRRAMDGTTVEILNTDAEGRLILADALCYARRMGLSPLVDVATLTGACIVALGKRCSGLFGNHPEWVERVKLAATQAGERLWELPLMEEYLEEMKSEVADWKNTAGREGGAIKAALFLRHFVKDIPWAHLDIAGTALTDSEQPYLPKGATGVATRTLALLACSLAEEPLGVHPRTEEPGWGPAPPGESP